MRVLSKQPGAISRVSTTVAGTLSYACSKSNTAYWGYHIPAQDEKVLLHDDPLGKPKGTPQDFAWWRHPADSRANNAKGAAVRVGLCAIGCACGEAEVQSSSRSVCSCHEGPREHLPHLKIDSYINGNPARRDFYRFRYSNVKANKPARR